MPGIIPAGMHSAAQKEADATDKRSSTLSLAHLAAAAEEPPPPHDCLLSLLLLLCAVRGADLYFSYMAILEILKAIKMQFST